MRTIRLAVFALLLAGCATAPASTPIVIYVTPAPTSAPTAAVTSPPSASPTPIPHSLTVEVTIRDPLYSGLILSYGDTECAGNNAWSDIAPGMQATIKETRAPSSQSDTSRISEGRLPSPATGRQSAALRHTHTKSPVRPSTPSIWVGAARFSSRRVT
jgi:hypothetical protein